MEYDYLKLIKFSKKNIFSLKIFLIICMLSNPLIGHALTIKSGQVFSSDGKIYDFASPEEKKLLIKKSKTKGKSIGIKNRSLFLIIKEEILHIPIDEIIWSSESQIANLVEKKVGIFFKDNDFDENENIIKDKLVLSAKKLKQLHILNKLENKISKRNLKGNFVKFYFVF